MFDDENGNSSGSNNSSKRGKDKSGLNYLAVYQASQQKNGSANSRRKTQSPSGEMGAAKGYGTDINNNRRQNVPAFNGQPASKWMQDANTKGAGSNSYNYPHAQNLLTMSPDPLLSKNHKVNAQLAPLNHVTPGSMPNSTNSKTSGLMANIPSIEQLATYNKL